LAAPQHGRSLYARTVSAIALADEARGRTLSCRTLRLLVLGMAQIVRHMPSKARWLPLLLRRELLV